jgi:N utilization substance protein B
MRQRTVARLAAVQAIYEMELAASTADTVLRGFREHRWESLAGGEVEAGGMPIRPAQNEPDQVLLNELVRGVAERQADLDAMIAPALSAEWPLERLEAVLRAILRAGAFELFARTDVPLRVVITEYVDIAHAFFQGKEPGLVNAVLDRLGRVLRRDEAGDDAGGSQEDPAG